MYAILREYAVMSLKKVAECLNGKKYRYFFNLSTGYDYLEYYAEAGQIEILENHNKISIGRVIAARDIIHKRARVYFGIKK